MTSPTDATGGDELAHARRKRAALDRAVAQFNNGQFYECHETLEEVWLAEPGRDHPFLQGLIQAAAAYHNLLRGRMGGGERLLRLAQEKLAPFAPRHLGLDVAALLAALSRGHRQVRTELREGVPRFDPSLIPRLHLDVDDM
jgi:predicted metal-dependent hydrolase